MTIGIVPALMVASLLSVSPSAVRCSTGEEAVAELRAAHEAVRRAHLEGNAELMGMGTADQIILASNGDLSMNSREQVVNFFRGYFARVQYLEWSDASLPIIHVSPDGGTGWMAVQVRARYLQRANPATEERAFRSSWIATYARVGCEWKMTGNSSTVVNE